MAVASDRTLATGKKILKIEGEQVVEISSNSLPWSLVSLWFIKDRKYYICGDGIFEKFHLSEEDWRNKPLDITTYYSRSARGTGYNNIAVSGSFGNIVYFNGKNWKTFYDKVQLINGNYNSVDLSANLIVAVGTDLPYAVVTIGRR